MELIAKLRRKATRTFDRVLDSSSALAGMLILLMMMLVSSAALMRYSAGFSPPGVIEICGYILLFITFMAGAWVLKIGGHVRVELLLDRLRPKGQRVLKGVTSLVSSVTWLIVTWYGIKVTWEHFQTGYYLYAEFETPSYITLAIIPLGGFILLIQLVRVTVQYWRGFGGTSGRKEA